MSAGTGGGAKGLCLSIVDDGFFVVGDAIGGGEDGRFDKGETHDNNMEWLIPCLIMSLVALVVGGSDEASDTTLPSIN